MQSVDADDEVGNTIAVDVAGNVGIADRLIGAQFAGIVTERRGADERERLVAAEQ